MDLLTSKLVSLTLLGVFTLFFGLIPLKVQKRLMKPAADPSEEAQRRQRLRRELIVSCLLCFGAGVLMATVFLHMLPETRENVELTRKPITITEETAHSMTAGNGTRFQGLKLGHDHEEHDHAEHGHVHKRSVNSSTEDINTTAQPSNTTSDSLLNQNRDNGNGTNTHNHEDHSHSHNHHDDHSNDHNHDHSHDHEHSEAALAPLLSDLTPSSLGVPSSALLKDPVTDTPALMEEGRHVHDHDHAGHSHAGHIQEGHNQMPSSTPAPTTTTPAPTTTPSSVIDDAHKTEAASSDQPQRDHRGHLHDHELTHGPYDRTHDNLEHILKPLKVDDSRSLSFVPHDHSQDHDHSHGDHDHSNDDHSHTGHDHEEANGHIQDLASNILENGTVDGYVDHDHNPASPIKVHVHDDHSDHDHGDDHHYPIAELLICLGFFLIYLIEEIVHKVVFRHQRQSHSKRELKGGAGSMVLTNRNSSLSPIKDQKRKSPITSNGVEGVFRPTASHSAENGHGNGYAVSDTVANGGMRDGSTASAGSLPPRAEWGTTGVDNPVFTADGEAEGPQMASIDYTNNSNPGHGHSHLEDLNKLKASDWVSSLRSLIVVVALSFHSVFEGLAVGLQQQVQDVWYLFYAIAAHKLVIAFCIGLELITGGTRTALTVVYMVVLALVTPLGIAIGIIITEGTDEPNSLSHRWTLTIMQGMAGGTILYVTFCEVLERERGRKEGRFLKLAALMIGFTTMAVVEALGQHKHTH